MHEILIGQHAGHETASVVRSALPDEDGAGAGTRIRSSRVALSRAAVEHHARISAGPRRSTSRQTATCAPACSAARHIGNPNC